MIKKCTVCGSKFCGHVNTKTCSEECRAHARREDRLRYIRKHPERVQRYRKENREKISAWHRQYREENKQRIAAYHRQHREENRELLREKSRIWYRENPEKARQYREENREKRIKQKREWNDRQKANRVILKELESKLAQLETLGVSL